jgi:type IV secretion system protein VirB11
MAELAARVNAQNNGKSVSVGHAAAPQDSVLGLLYASFGEIRGLLADPEVSDIYVNDNGYLWVDRVGKGRANTGIVVPPDKAETVVRLIAAKMNTTVNPAAPIISAEIPADGSRFEGVLPPVTERPVFAIRRRAEKIFRLDDYVKNKVMTPTQRKAIERAVKDRKNILVVGGTGSGKTTLVNAILDYIAQATDDRVVILEDTRELQCAAADRLCMRTTDTIDMTRLLKSCMRLRPDRIVVGEVRGKEALDMLKAWNTGHPGGVCTIHANSAEQGLSRVMVCAPPAA